jgi:hypothetical protein
MSLLGWKYKKFFAGDQFEAIQWPMLGHYFQQKGKGKAKAKTRQEFAFFFYLG